MLEYIEKNKNYKKYTFVIKQTSCRVSLLDIFNINVVHIAGRRPQGQAYDIKTIFGLSARTFAPVAYQTKRRVFYR